MNNKFQYKYLCKPERTGTSVYTGNTIIQQQVIDDSSFYDKSVPGYVNASSKSQDIFLNVKKSLSSIDDSKLKIQLLSFINIFQSVMSEMRYEDNPLPPFSISADSDMIFLEWIFRDFRVGFTFSDPREEPIWFLVSNKNMRRMNYSGDLVQGEYRTIITGILEFVLRNT